MSMRFGYGWLLEKASRHFKRIMLVAGLIALPITIRVDKVAAEPKPISPPAIPPKPIPPDLRTIRLKKFFSKLHCPITYLADDFVHAADANQLDWRLLPSISLVESSGGKAYRNNNIFGWNKGDTLFPTIRAGIEEVAFKLGRSPLYRNRDVAGKLRLYNPDESYAGTVLSVMNRISPVVNLKRVRRMAARNSFAYAAD